MVLNFAVVLLHELVPFWKKNVEDIEGGKEIDRHGERERKRDRKREREKWK